MSVQLFEYTVPVWSISGLINNDYSGVDNDDKNLIRSFINRLDKEFGRDNWHISVSEDDPAYYRSNDMTSTPDNCITITIRSKTHGNY